jgi:hypothetical protein
MKKIAWIYKTILAVVISLATVTMSTLPAYATPQNQGRIGSEKNSQAGIDETGINSESRKFKSALWSMEDHLFINNKGLLQLDVETGAAIGIDEETFSAVKAGMETTNTLLQSGEITLDQIALDDGEPLMPISGKGQDGFFAASAACAGRSGYSFSWWHLRLTIYLNECRTQELISLLQNGTQSVCQIIVAWIGLSGFIASLACQGLARLVSLAASYLRKVDASGGYRGLVFQVSRSGFSVGHQ